MNDDTLYNSRVDEQQPGETQREFIPIPDIDLQVKDPIRTVLPVNVNPVDRVDTEIYRPEGMESLLRMSDAVKYEPRPEPPKQIPFTPNFKMPEKLVSINPATPYVSEDTNEMIAGKTDITRVSRPAKKGFRTGTFIDNIAEYITNLIS